MKIAYAILFLGIVLFSCSYTLPVNFRNETSRNKEIVAEAFEQWQQQEGSLFDLLDENVEWIVSGSGIFSGTYKGKQNFLDKAVTPISGKLTSILSQN